jgi:hypothetical protein
MSSIFGMLTVWQADKLAAAAQNNMILFLARRLIITPLWDKHGSGSS